MQPKQNADADIISDEATKYQRFCLIHGTDCQVQKTVVAAVAAAAAATAAAAVTAAAIHLDKL